MVRKLWPPGKNSTWLEAGTVSPAFAVYAFISERVTEWTVPELEEPICMGKNPACPQTRPLRKRFNHSL